MANQTGLEKHIIDILEIARFAPSVHNTQPWIVKIKEDMIRVTIDPRFTLTDGDPTGRETIISLGIFAEALCIGIASCGLTVKSIEHKASELQVTVGAGSKIHNDDVKLIKTRCTDRSIYKPVEIPETLTHDFEQVWRSNSVKIHASTDKGFIESIAVLTSKGIRLALSSPSFRRELSNYLVRPMSSRKRGISTRSLYLPMLLQVVEPWFMRLGIGLGAEAKLEKMRWLSSSGVAIITADGDMPEYWFEVGRAYLKLSLAIEKAGLSQATSAAIVEASDFHDDIESLLGTNQRILCIIRFGKGREHRFYSPRVTAKELLST